MNAPDPQIMADRCISMHVELAHFKAYMLTLLGNPKHRTVMANGERGFNATDAAERYCREHTNHAANILVAALRIDAAMTGHDLREEVITLPGAVGPDGPV